MRVSTAFAVFASFVIVACQKQAAAFGEPVVVSKEARANDWDASLRDRMGMSQPPPQQPEAVWAATVPPGWEQLPAQPSRFRELLLRIVGQPDTECYLTSGVRGGVVANLQRWYVQQAGRSEAPVAETLPMVDFGGNPARFAELSGTIDGKPDWAMLIVFAAQGEFVTTLKFVGPSAVVLPQKDNFLGVARSVRREAVAGKGAAPVESGWSATMPAGWEELPAQPSRFRDLLYRVAGQPDTECYLTGSVGGGSVMNLQRWYVQQAGRDAAPAAETLPEVAFAGAAGRYVELTGTIDGKPDWAMLIVFAAQGDQVTTLKFVGPAAVLLPEKDNFLQLAKSVRRGGTGAAAGTGSSAGTGAGPLPSNHPAMPPPTAAHAAAAPFTADAPAGWSAKADSPRLLHHTFGSDGEVYVSQLGGTPRQMFDIWRGEIGAQPLDDRQFADLKKVPMMGGEALLMDVTGEFRSMTGKHIPAARLLVAAFSDGAAITFVKLVGPAAEVQAQVAAFETFCGSLRRSK